MAVKDVRIRIKGGLEANFDAATLLARELAVTTDTGKLYMGVGDGTAKLLNDIPQWSFTGGLVLLSTSTGGIVESTITTAQLAVLNGLGALLDTIDGRLEDLESVTENLGSMAYEDAADFRTSAQQDSIDETHLVKTDIKAGTNVVLSSNPNASTGTPAEAREITISVPGIPMPDKWVSTENGHGAIGSRDDFDATMMTLISGLGPLTVGDVVIFANGFQAEITDITGLPSTVEVVIISIPQTIAWGGIGGTLSTQTDLQGALDAKVDKTTTVAGKPLSANVTLGKLTVFNGEDDQTPAEPVVVVEYDGSTNEAFDLKPIIDEALTEMAGEIATQLEDKMDLVDTPTANNLLATDANGQAVDSGIAKASVLLVDDVLDGGTF